MGCYVGSDWLAALLDRSLEQKPIEYQQLHCRRRSRAEQRGFMVLRVFVLFRLWPARSWGGKAAKEDVIDV